ncbi:related to cephalosporin C regulator 1 (cpcR1 gene) [Cephalotrichum gorgonifer]|uniref:Related to cephalosporin C regulator 1 (CpcR1 gene) n=1 Tax=Cephalotrichum gorgonifer TaxID=2041049 RepID=A0AAE8STL4_9PEZI|nr:related to cephalosporin C regulator 1 (cpcR1 gene) [Cephalotrichum gorgonifer]
MEKETTALAKARRRPLSRASTASIHSISTQPSLEQSFGDGTEVYHGQWAGNLHAHSKALMGAPHMSAEDAILQAAPHIQPGPTGARGFTVDPVMDASMAHSGSFQHASSFARHDISANLSMTDMGSFTDPDSQMLDPKHEDPNAPAPAVQKTSSRTSANNEREMQQLFMANKHRRLNDVAKELHGNERGPNSERQRQVISQVCTRGKGSVPRGRVYANYASRCATERITVLNPASFGKLVRVLFPGLKTRRLGVRGESKYHYVNFTLIEDQPELAEPEIQQPLALPETSNFVQNFNPFPATSNPDQADKASVPTPREQENVEPQPARRRIPSSHSIYNLPDVSTLDQLNATSTKTSLELRFIPASETPPAATETIILPRIEPFLPVGTDPDAAKSLAALYRSHCTSLIECIRYCKEKTFFHLFTSFQGTLTMPVQRLLGSPAVAQWIEECDFVLYQRTMQIISGLTLQVVPKPVLDTLRSISERLVPHIRDAFQGQPAHVIRAKEAPATIFAALVDRSLRVNLTAHAAANMLSNPANRDQMYHDWISMVRVRKVAECVPTRGMDSLVQLLLTEIRDLLNPVNVQWEFECVTIYGDVAARAGREPNLEESGGAGSSNVLDRWVAFLRSLPERFPYASATEIVWCVQRVGTAVMRDLTMAQGKSFGSWWVTKCWVDEMVSFMAEHGGFMKLRSTQTAAAATKPQTASKETTSQPGRCGSGSGGDEFQVSSFTQAQPDKTGFSQRQRTSQENVDADVNTHDDSGIGIRTPEEDFPMDKFGFTTAEDASLLPGETLAQHATGV